MTQQLIKRSNVDRAVTQLLCLVLGSKHSKESRHLYDNLSERLELCSELVEQDLGLSLKSSDPKVKRNAVKRAKTKIESIESLKTINQLIHEIQW
tara:strand:- start:19 stop:303 length:285 start_codon:yes stop_codon:yes gene_type:complete